MHGRHVNEQHIALYLLLLLLATETGCSNQMDYSQLPGSGSTSKAVCPPEIMSLRVERYLLQLCRQNPDVAMEAIYGLREAVNECQFQMRFNRWDCMQHQSQLGHDVTILHQPFILKHGYKESAFLLAMSSAGVAWSVARACSSGKLASCQCNLYHHASQQNWAWGGCSYGVKYGLTTSRKLLTPKRGKRHYDIVRTVQSHNLKTGRLAVKKTLSTQCKCHGVSASCQMKTCWKVAADLKEMGNYLGTQLRSAQLISLSHAPNDSKTTVVSARASELIAYEESPSFCNPITSLRTQGVRSRVCAIRNATHREGDCNQMCCGRGHQVSREVTKEACRCKFVWCCDVRCDQCERVRFVSRCN